MDQEQLNRENAIIPGGDRSDKEVTLEFELATRLVREELKHKSVSDMMKEYDDVTGEFETHSLSAVRVFRSDEGDMMFWAVCDIRGPELLLIALDTTLVKREIQLYLDNLEKK